MKLQKIMDKPQQGSVSIWYETMSWPFYKKSLIFHLYMYLSEKAIFYHKPALVTSLRLFNNQTTELTWKWVQIVKIYNGTGSRHG